ncbi:MULTISPECIES: glycosyltransferase [Paracoccaceae]|uniref:glycosyltransferase n=1 Tax=Rhodobacterales TaxID=204455 RepID=UPI001AFDDC89|nr:glycosyltransferase [Boseongicola sp. H5]MBO6624259.1 glycosyltransferase [Roseicyclus sp.]MBO6921390.1 glycosyltransferase [Roseicyclus sp.]
MRSIFSRYADQHITLKMPGFPLGPDPDHPTGYVDFYTLAGDHVHVVGWSTASHLILSSETQSGVARPDIPRPDVASALNLADTAALGFELTMPRDGTDLTLTSVTGSFGHAQPLPGPGTAEVRAAQRALRPEFARLLFRNIGPILRWKLFRDTRAYSRIISELGFDRSPSGRGLLDDDLFARTDTAHPAAMTGARAETQESSAGTGTVTIILPVYNALDLLPEVLDRVMRHTDIPFRLIILEDCSSDPAVRPYLRDWREGLGSDAPVELLENEQNLGFIGSVNRGLARARDLGEHVILLNSDAFVPQGWASRLMQPILTGDKVATVTPMSNDAEIFSVPGICRRNVLLPGQADLIDRAARWIDPVAGQAATPTGVGFCMAINAAFLRRLPALDTVFGRGYGEEVDWCQKAAALGGRHIGLGNLFVEHRGGESFGTLQKQELLRRNGATISRRYPRYDAQVQDFIATDPLKSVRLALAIAWAGSLTADPLPIYLAHSLGGGAERYLEREISRRIAAGGAAVVLRVGGASRLTLEVHGAFGTISGHTGNLVLVTGLLASTGPRRVIYSCGVGDADPVGLPEILSGLKRGPEDRLEILFHDFFPLSPSYVLLDEENRFTGVPAADSTARIHSILRPDGTHVPLRDWRKAWGALIAKADGLTVFSRDSRDLVTAAYPEAADRITVAPHEMLARVPAILRPPEGPRPVLGVLGDIGMQKGAGVVSAICKKLTGPGQRPFDMAVIGNFDRAFPMPDWVPIHGSYAIGEIPDLVARYGVSHWLIPSIWPETFSFVTHEALATGLPVFCFDLGAQAEAVRQAGPPNRVISRRGTSRLIADLSAAMAPAETARIAAAD